MAGLGSSIAVLLWIGVGTLLAGLIVLFRGLRPPRRGSEPHCRKCEYNLTGLTSPRCPECGSQITTPQSTVLGTRSRRPGLIAVGLLLAAIAVLPLCAVARRINWYHYYPASWIANELLSPATSSRAYAELTRRINVGRSTAVVRALIQMLDRNPSCQDGYSFLTFAGTPPAQTYLQQVLRSPDPQVRELAVRGLASARGRWAPPLLIPMLDDDSLWLSPLSYPGSNEHLAVFALGGCLSSCGLPSDIVQGPPTLLVIDEEISAIKAWWARYGEDFVQGKPVPNPNIHEFRYDGP